MLPARKQTGFRNLRSLTEALNASFDTASGGGTGAAGPGATPSQLHPSTMVDPGCTLRSLARWLKKKTKKTRQKKNISGKADDPEVGQPRNALPRGQSIEGYETTPPGSRKAKPLPIIEIT